MSQFHSLNFKHGPETYEINGPADLKNVPTPALLALYRKLTGKDTTRFASREKGEAAVVRAMEAQAAPQPKKAAAKPAKAPRAPKAPSERKARTRRFVFKKDSTLKPPREGTKRYDLLKLLRQERGATEAEIQEKIGWTDKQAYEGIRLLHFAHGYGLEQDENNRIKVIE
jgi:DNA-nicking Smr family endonuclease